MPSDLAKFQNDSSGVRQTHASAEQAARVTKVSVPAAAEARARVGLSQQEFAGLLGVSARTLQDWSRAVGNPLVQEDLLRVAVSHRKYSATRRADG